MQGMSVKLVETKNLGMLRTGCNWAYGRLAGQCRAGMFANRTVRQVTSFLAANKKNDTFLFLKTLCLQGLSRNQVQAGANRRFAKRGRATVGASRTVGLENKLIQYT